jgi:PKD repeat protein
MKKKLYLFSLLLFCFGSIYSQNNSITGIVTDQLSQTVVPNQVVNLAYHDSLAGTITTSTTNTNASGTYAFNNLSPIGPGSYYEVKVMDCMGNYQSIQVSSFGAVADFYICTQTPPGMAIIGASKGQNATLEIQFIDQSMGNPTSWLWNFGDGTTSTLQNPTHTYSTAGTKLITLNITGNGFQSVDTLFLHVNNVMNTQPTADFTYNVVNANTASVQFTALGSTNILRRKWEFHDGNQSIACGYLNPLHQFPQQGLYYVQYTVWRANCVHSKVIPVVISNSNSTCAAIFSSALDSSSVHKVQFTDQSTGNPTSWFWDFGDGFTTSLQNPSHTYAQPGNYTVSLTIGGGVCQYQNSTVSQNIQVMTIGNTCVSNYSYYVDTNIINLYHFVDQSLGYPTTWLWDFGDGTTSTAQYPTHTYTQGTYNVSLTVGGGICQGTQLVSTQTIHVGPGPQLYPDIYGQVRVGNDTTIAGTANLYVANTGALYATMPITSAGNYYFNNVPVGNYVVAAYPDSNSTYFGTHMNTYYGDVVNWANATVINHTQQLSVNYPIELQAMVVTPGVGQVSGNVGNNSKSGISGVHVYLLNDNDEVVKSDITNTSGDYNLGSIDVGNYEIYVEMPGYNSTPKQIVLTSNANQSLGNDFVVSGNTVVPVTTSITDLNTIAISTVYPNPVIDILNISMTSTELQEATVSIYSLSGQLLYSEEVDLNYESNFKVNMEAFEKGTYLVSVSSVKGEVQRILINKM